MLKDDQIQFPAFEDDDICETQPRIVVFGVGGAGGNAVNTMIDKALDGVQFVAANTDAQALSLAKAPVRVQLGAQTAKGLGAGANPEIGARAADESAERIAALLDGADMCFIAAGMGGGTGTGAAPVIAKIAREKEVLTVGVVTKPFEFEGKRRMRVAEAGLEMLTQFVDTLIVTPNQNLFRVANERTTFSEAFTMADDVLYQGVKGVTDLMIKPGVVNLDFRDVRAVMGEMGKAMMGSGEGSGERRTLDALEKAIDNPLLDEVTLKGARGVLINITGGMDLTLFEVDEAANRVRKEVDPDANVIWGSALDPAMEGKVRVSVVATGIEVATGRRNLDKTRARAAEALSASRSISETARPTANPMRDGDGYDAPRPYRDRAQEAQQAAAETQPEKGDCASVVAMNADADANAAAATQRASEAETPHDKLVRKLAGEMVHPSPAATEPATDAQQAASTNGKRQTLGFGMAGGRDSAARVEIPSFLRRQAT